MSSNTESRIQKLCTEAIAANTQTAVDRIMPEVRLVLEEHIRLAKECLEEQASTISILDAASQTTEDLPPRKAVK